MKALLLVLTIMMPSLAHASEFLCTQASSKKWVRIETETETTPGTITYGVDAEVQRSFVLPNNVMELTQERFDLFPPTVRVGNLSILVSVSILLDHGSQASVLIIETQGEFSDFFAFSQFRCLEF